MNHTFLFALLTLSFHLCIKKCTFDELTINNKKTIMNIHVVSFLKGSGNFVSDPLKRSLIELMLQ